VAARGSRRARGGRIVRDAGRGVRQRSATCFEKGTSPVNKNTYAPWISDPDPPVPKMSREESRAGAERAREFMEQRKAQAADRAEEEKQLRKGG
jgi:hypothetical protein